ncbi:MAG: hypothetical protein COA36_04790 [Desulfotalea sp.]|nr:MAG: hypothetical protein COA36_04790 [Desulfotalea sp.]
MKVNIAKKVQNKEGFTLVELMIVVAIIGILAAIAIPNFLAYQMKSKSAEAKTNMGAIKTSLIAYAAERDEYLTAPSTPAGANADATGKKAAWVATPGVGLTALGFAPSGDVYYRYAITDAFIWAPGTLTAVGPAAPATSTPGTGITPTVAADVTINTKSDLDGDGAKTGGFSMTDIASELVDNNPGEY